MLAVLSRYSAPFVMLLCGPLRYLVIPLFTSGQHLTPHILKPVMGKMQACGDEDFYGLLA